MIDSIELVVQDPILVNYLAEKILTKAEAVQARRKHGKVQHLAGRKVGAELGVYRKHIAGLYKGKFILCAWANRHSRQGYRGEGILLFHMTQFRDLTEVQGWLEELFDTPIKALKQLKVRRLDACVDLEISFDYIRLSLDVPSIRKTISYSQLLGRTHYWGTDRRRQLYAYERAKGTRLEVRIETRLRKDANPIGTFGDLLDRKSFFPFGHVTLLVPMTFQKMDLSPVKRTQLESFCHLRSLHGFSEAKRIVSRRHKNFSRDIKPLLEPSPLDLERIWTASISRFYGLPATLVAGGQDVGM